MVRVSAFSFCAALVFSVVTTSVSMAKIETDSKAHFEYQALPGALGNGRSQEGWVGFDFGLKFKPEANERLRIEALISGDFLLLSPSTATVSAQTLGATQALEWNKSGSPHFFEDRELFAEYRFGRARASIGARTLRWGIADFFDPLDQINSRRMENPAQSTKRGEWMLFTELRASDKGTISVEAFVIPVKRGAILPSQTSAWLPRQLYIPYIPDAEFRLPTTVEYQYRDREEQDAALRWNTGARILWRPGETEVNFQYDEGASSFPSVRPTVTGVLVETRPDGRQVIQADPLVRLTEVYYRERHYGASVVQPLGTTLTRLQIGKTEPIASGRSLANDRSDLTLAFERQVGLGSWGSVTILAQGFANLLAKDEGGTDVASFSKLFDRAAALGFRFAPSETTSFTIGALRSLSTKGGAILMSNLSFDLGSSLTAELGWTMYEAPLDSPIGPYKDNDGGSLKLTASF
jgi:hypothetical protein